MFRNTCRLLAKVAIAVLVTAHDGVAFQTCSSPAYRLRLAQTNNARMVLKAEPSPLSAFRSRRSFVFSAFTLGPAAVASTLLFPQVAAAADSKESLLKDLEASKAKMESIPELLKNMEWDAVRTILKTPPVNQLWNLGESQNTLVKLAKQTGDFEFLELKDELALTLQMCDQLTYDNAFVYFQPGNGKIKIKEPTDLAMKGMEQIQEAINIGQSS